MTPKGKLIVIGGAVDKGSFTEKNYEKDIEKNLNFFERGILKRIITESKNKNESRIEVVTTASQIPEEVGNEYVKAFSYLEVNNVGVLGIKSREDANATEAIKRLDAADVVMFTGGDQLRLTTILGGTAFHKTLQKKYLHDPFVIAGTSAGAAACSNNMIYQGSAHEALLKGEVKITSGLGLINDVIIDTHFVHRGRIGRLFQAVVSNPIVLGIGLGEDTGLLITHGKTMEAIGSGLVILVDGRHINDTNITEVELGEPISIENLVAHVMSKGDFYDLETHQLQIHKSVKPVSASSARLDS
jgi:cyanophycinase